MSSPSRTPSLTPSRSPTPEPPLQPDHFYGAENAQRLPPSPDSDGKTWLDPDDDPMAQRGIPVFKPTIDEFRDFEAYMEKVECWGKRSGIVKVIPPKEWTDALPPLNSQLGKVKLKTPIEQHMLGRGGLFRQENVEKRRIMSVREWAELCAKEDLRAPGVDDIGLHARANAPARKTRRGKKTREPETAEPDADVEIKEEEDTTATLNDDGADKSLASPPDSVGAPRSPAVDHNVDSPPEFVQGESGASADATSVAQTPVEGAEGNVKPKGKRTREAQLAERAVKDEAFMETFDPHSDWLPPNTTPFDYTPEFCKELERRFWRNCGLGKPAWYGADMQGSLFTEETSSWNVASLNSALSRLLPTSSQGLPGVNTPYLYFGMWRATFAWHVEDMDLFSINYIHFGAPKFWYAIPQARASALETTMRGYFPKDVSQCPQFLRHKSFLASPNLLSKDSCRPNTVVQRAGEFIITFPMGYHAGFNLGFNCAESVNFALQSWLDLGRKAKACECVNFSVRIDVDQLLRDRQAEQVLELKAAKSRRKGERGVDKDGKPKASKKRKSEPNDSAPKAKKQKTSKPIKSEDGATEAPDAKASSSKTMSAKVTLKLGPKPREPEAFPCCLCINMSQEKLLRVLDPPVWRKEGDSEKCGAAVWMAHEECANVVPETWIDEIEVGEAMEDGTRAKERVVFGVDGIVKDRWNLKCSACTKTRHRAHGAPIQCTKGKCPKAFHVSCARDGATHSIVYNVLREVEKEVVLLDYRAASEVPAIVGMAADLSGGQSQTMNVDQTAQLGASGTASTNNGPHVLKLIRKVEVQVLCSQHNPAIAEAKKAMKQDKIRNELLALPTMSRIKLRVSAGVFEVSLIRVIEESSSVEVLWDRGVKREFKWGSVVFGNTEGVTVGQKPAEPAPEPEQPVLAPMAQRPRLSFPPLSTTTPTIQYRPQTIAPAAMASLPTPVPATPSPVPTYQPPLYQPHTSNYQYAPGAWTYQYPTRNAPPQYSAPGSSTQSYQYGGMQRTPCTPPAQYQPYPPYNYTPQQYQSRGLQWQRPYTGPKVQPTPDGGSTQTVQSTVPYYSSYPYGTTSGYSQQQAGAPPLTTGIPTHGAIPSATQPPASGVPPP